jgi:hypothetical protein
MMYDGVVAKKCVRSNAIQFMFTLGAGSASRRPESVSPKKQGVALITRSFYETCNFSLCMLLSNLSTKLSDPDSYLCLEKLTFVNFTDTLAIRYLDFRHHPMSTLTPLTPSRTTVKRLPFPHPTSTELLIAYKPLAGELGVGRVTSSEFIFNNKFDSPRRPFFLLLSCES